MVKSTPHPPYLTQHQPFGYNLGDNPLFNVREGFRVDEALEQACEHLSCAAATAYETADNIALEFRPLARAVVHQIEVARALVEASIAGLSLSSV
ncbi:DUF6124 family protein [Pseudomonas sp. nanlin1]|uniref:DUF6124 family protein n=1 Tax=Pseudomonas sp. nanlin1 TaxID=3040605 RepID=UPI00388D6DA3